MARTRVARNVPRPAACQLLSIMYWLLAPQQMRRSGGGQSRTHYSAGTLDKTGSASEHPVPLAKSGAFAKSDVAVEQCPMWYSTLGPTRLRHEATMSSDATPVFEEPDPTVVANLKLEVRQAYRPGRWMWQLVDARDGTVLEKAFEFEYASDAELSGLARLAELTPSLPGARAAGRSSHSGLKTRLVIVSRKEEALYEELRRLFADSSSVAVIVDRRCFARRRSNQQIRGDRGVAQLFEWRAIERRSGQERRANRIDVAIQARGWWTVPVWRPRQ